MRAERSAAVIVSGDSSGIGMSLLGEEEGFNEDGDYDEELDHGKGLDENVESGRQSRWTIGLPTSQ